MICAEGKIVIHVGVWTMMMVVVINPRFSWRFFCVEHYFVMYLSRRLYYRGGAVLGVLDRVPWGATSHYLVVGVDEQEVGVMDVTREVLPASPMSLTR